MKLWIGVALCGAMLVAGCSSSGDGAVDAAPTAPATSGSSAGSTGGAATPTSTFTAKPDCGRVEPRQGDGTVPEYGCLLAAVEAGITAKLVVVRLTVEGDPVPTTYTVRPGGTVEIRRDSRADKFGSEDVTLRVCPARTFLRDEPSTVGCSPEIPASAAGDPTQTGPSGTS